MTPRNATEIGQRRAYVWQGQKYPSVTTILKVWPQEWAIAYGAKHVALRATEEYGALGAMLERDPDGALRWLKAAPNERRDVAGDYGTDLHAYLEDRVKGVPAPDGLTDGQRAIEQFLATYRPEFLFVESQVFGLVDGWAGTADAFVRIYGRVYVLDLKTSPNAPTDHKARLQLAAYAHGDFIGENGREIARVPSCDGGLILSVPRDYPARWSLIETPAGRDEYAVFLAAQRLWFWYVANNGTSIGELLLPQLGGAA